MSRLLQAYKKAGGSFQSFLRSEQRSVKDIVLAIGACKKLNDLGSLPLHPTEIKDVLRAELWTIVDNRKRLETRDVYEVLRLLDRNDSYKAEQLLQRYLADIWQTSDLQSLSMTLGLLQRQQPTLLKRYGDQFKTIIGRILASSAIENDDVDQSTIWKENIDTKALTSALFVFVKSEDSADADELLKRWILITAKTALERGVCQHSVVQILYCICAGFSKELSSDAGRLRTAPVIHRLLQASASADREKWNVRSAVLLLHALRVGRVNGTLVNALIDTTCVTFMRHYLPRDRMEFSATFWTDFTFVMHDLVILDAFRNCDRARELQAKMTVLVTQNKQKLRDCPSRTQSAISFSAQVIGKSNDDNLAAFFLRNWIRQLQEELHNSRKHIRKQHINLNVTETRSDFVERIQIGIGLSHFILGNKRGNAFAYLSLRELSHLREYFIAGEGEIGVVPLNMSLMQGEVRLASKRFVPKISCEVQAFPFSIDLVGQSSPVQVFTTISVVE